MESVELALADAGIGGLVPEEIAEAGAANIYADFFIASYDNEHTRRAYKRHVERFLDWCEARDLGLRELRAHHAAAYRGS